MDEGGISMFPNKRKIKHFYFYYLLSNMPLC